MNNRNVRIGVFVFLLVIISFLTDSIGYTTSITAGNSLMLASEPGVNSFISMAQSIYLLATFQIVGVPFIVTLVVLIITLWLALDLLSMVKGLIPFTSGE
jgi:hypothetical protein